jgi:hypothetical protein
MTEIKKKLPTVELKELEKIIKSQVSIISFYAFVVRV